MRLIERLDVAYEWLPWPPPTGDLPLVDFGDGCNDPTPFSAKDSVILIVRKAASKCTYAEIIR